MSDIDYRLGWDEGYARGYAEANADAVEENKSLREALLRIYRGDGLFGAPSVEHLMGIAKEALHTVEVGDGHEGYF